MDSGVENLHIAIERFIALRNAQLLLGGFSDGSELEKDLAIAASEVFREKQKLTERLSTCGPLQR